MPDNGKWLVLFDALNVLAFWLCRRSNQSIHWILLNSLALPPAHIRFQSLISVSFLVFETLKVRLHSEFQINIPTNTHIWYDWCQHKCNKHLSINAINFHFLKLNYVLSEPNKWYISFILYKQIKRIPMSQLTICSRTHSEKWMFWLSFCIFGRVYQLFNVWNAFHVFWLR